jgi:uncharacterized repeat protein (TIGR01451 family)
VQPIAALSLLPRDRMTITPDRILAPVGTEVVLKTGICTAEGYLLADQKVEWQLGRNGVGQFVELGGKGWVHPPLLPWNQGRKIDNYYAVGYTANGPHCITRGNADPSDDVEILRGDAWVSVSSPVEGTSHVTARAPSVVESWADRSASATIYWVDVQWTFPPADISSGGRPETLTTLVARQTDGTPVEGWVVRYTTAEASQLGPDAAGQSVEVLTGVDGKASVEIAPTDSGAPSTRIDIQLIRPAGHRGGDAPRLVVANGASTLHWGADTTPYLPPGNPLPPTSATPSPTTPLPAGPYPGSSGPIPTSPLPSGPTPTPAAGQPSLDVQIRGDREVEVGGIARFEVVIRNTGTAAATGIVLRDRFPAQLSHLNDPNRNLEIANAGIGTLSPGEAKTVPLSFDVLETGKLCHDVTISCSETQPVSRRACIDAIRARPRLKPGLKVQKDGPVQAEAGQTVLYTITVKNTGEVPLTGVVVKDEYPLNLLSPQPRQPGFAIEQSNVVWRIPRLEPGQTQRFDVDVKCLRPAARVLSYVAVTGRPEAGDEILTNDDHAMEVVPARSAPPVAPSAPSSGSQTLRLRLTTRANPLLVGAATICEVTIENLSRETDQDVELAVKFPPEMIPNVAQAQGPPGIGAQLAAGTVRFSKLAAIRGNETVTYLIPVSGGRPGTVEVVAEVRSSKVPQLQQLHSQEIIR